MKFLGLYPKLPLDAYQLNAPNWVYVLGDGSRYG